MKKRGEGGLDNFLCKRKLAFKRPGNRRHGCEYGYF